MTTILVLEDEPANLEIFAAILWSKGYSVLEAATGREALEAAQRQQGAIDLLICDVGLNGEDLSGTEVALAILDGRDDLPVVFVSGNPVAHWDSRDRQNFKLLNQECVTVLEKPFLPSDLGNAVELLLHKSAEPRSVGHS